MDLRGSTKVWSGSRRVGSKRSPAITATNVVGCHPVAIMASQVEHGPSYDRFRANVWKLMAYLKTQPRVWDEHADPATNVVRVTMSTLRRKLGEPPLVETVIGRGYRIS